MDFRVVSLIVSGLAVVTFVSLTNSCSRNDSSSSGSKVAAVFKGSALIGASLRPVERRGTHSVAAASVTITNVSGLADSLLGNTDENHCGFSIWSANSQSGPVAIAGRTYEAFDLGDPSNWTSIGTGLRSGCNGGTVQELEVYWPYFDLALSVDGVDEVIRIVTSDYGVYKGGDALIKVGSKFYWSDLGGTSLTADDATRPASPYQISNMKATLNYSSDSGDTPAVGRLKGKVVDDSGNPATVTVTPEIHKVVVDFKFDGFAPAISDSSTSARTLTTFTAAGITSFAPLPLKAKLTALTCAQIGTAADPEPQLAWQAANGCSTASPTPSVSSTP